MWQTVSFLVLIKHTASYHIISYLSVLCCYDCCHRQLLLCFKGVNVAQLDQVAHTLIASHLLYSLPVYCGFRTVDLKSRIETTVKRLSQYGYLTESFSFNQLCQCCSFVLFTKLQNIIIVCFICLLLKCYLLHTVSLHLRSHNYTLCWNWSDAKIQTPFSTI